MRVKAGWTSMIRRHTWESWTGWGFFRVIVWLFPLKGSVHFVVRPLTWWCRVQGLLVPGAVCYRRFLCLPNPFYPGSQDSELKTSATGSNLSFSTTDDFSMLRFTTFRWLWLLFVSYGNGPGRHISIFSGFVPRKLDIIVCFKKRLLSLELIHNS